MNHLDEQTKKGKNSVINAFNTSDELVKFAKQIAQQHTPPVSKPKLVLGAVAWLIVYGGGALFLLYMLFALLMELS